ncbi:FecCD family ABC transporter permease [Cryptosporangium aurantiacum]|uniref:Iron complex transport system permease protein n=1 Tax=Cryptosporangium aurantiacum TaxID=134849 RepID=A0A1M7RN80_9ACTN|nr:iron ABC transporter permease [Cryptosporangium aurantiacum]SHN47526.1 iron complex transport system permease protein [Cryptosporangium aurantiacum]
MSATTRNAGGVRVGDRDPVGRARATGRRGIRIGPVGIRFRRRAAIVTLVLLVLTTAVGTVGMFTGTLDFPPDRVWAALRGDGTRIENLVLLDGRLARVALGALVGLLLGISGALTQTLTRNPIASPDILGVTAGAGLFAVVFVTNPAALSAVGIPVRVGLPTAAVLGASVTTGLILALSWRVGFDGFRLVLVGLGVNAIAIAGTSWLLTRATLEEAAVAQRWLTGSLDGAEPADLWIAAPFALLGVVACVRLAAPLHSVRLGRELAAGLGARPAVVEASALGVAVVLAAAAVAVAGPIGFVAFVAPQAAMRLFGTAGPPPLAAGLTGALLVTAADLTAQRLPVEVPVGVVTSVVGAPALLLLLARYARRTHA